MIVSREAVLTYHQPSRTHERDIQELIKVRQSQIDSLEALLYEGLLTDQEMNNALELRIILMREIRINGGEPKKAFDSL